MKWFRKKESEREQIALDKLMDFLNISYTGSEKSRLNEVTYYTCMKVLSEALSKLPLNLQKVTDKSGIVDMVTDPAWYTARVRPNPYMTPSTFWAAVENNRNHYGNAYVKIDRTDKGINLWILDPRNIQIFWDGSKDLSETADIFYIYTFPDGKKKPFPSDDILHFKTSTTFMGLVGMSVQEKLKLSLDGAYKSQDMLNKMYDNQFSAKAVVQFAGTSEVNKTLRDQYLKSLEEYATGKNSNSKLFIPIPFGSTLTPIDIKLTDGQFLELRKYTALQIASAFGIKPNYLNDYDKSSYSNSEAQQLAFYTETMLYIIKQYEEELNFKLLSDTQRKNGYRFKFNIAAVLRGDTRTQVESLTRGVANALYTPNEARRNLDLPAKSGGDELYFNGSNIPITLAGTQYQQAPKGGEQNGNSD